MFQVSCLNQTQCIDGDRNSDIIFCVEVKFAPFLVQTKDEVGHTLIAFVAVMCNAVFRPEKIDCVEGIKLILKE